jgi:hypothetical protein
MEYPTTSAITTSAAPDAPPDQRRAPCPLFGRRALGRFPLLAFLVFYFSFSHQVSSSLVNAHEPSLRRGCKS